MNKKLLFFLLIKLWIVIILVAIFFIIPFFRSLKFNDETEISTQSEIQSGRHQWKDLHKDKNLNLKTGFKSLKHVIKVSA